MVGNGELSINTLNGECTFNGSPIKHLSIGQVLNAWLRDDLIQNHISENELDEALLKVSVEIEPPEYGSRFTNFIFICGSHLVSGSDVYTHSFKDKQSFECKKAI